MELFFWQFFFWFQEYNFFIFIHHVSTHSSGHYQSSFLISEFLAESLEASKNKRKGSLILQCSFAQKTSLILWNSTHLTLNMLPQHSWKPLWNFPVNMFLFGVKKEHLNCTISWRPRAAYFKRFESKCPYISVYLRKKMFVPKT